MVSKSKILGSLASVGFFFSVVSGSVAEPAQNPSFMAYHQATAQMGTFHQINQSIPLKVAVAIGGLSLIVLELWWFLWSKKFRPGNRDNTRSHG
jgi:plastocyanin domain-containing protein